MEVLPVEPIRDSWPQFSRYDAPDGMMENSRRQSLSYQPQSQNQQLLSVDGSSFGRRRRSLSVNRYENVPDTPPPPSEEGRSSRMRPSSSMISLGRGFSNDWDMSTSKRNFKFSQEGFDMARSAPIVHQPTLKIGMEGRTHFVHGKTEDYPAYRPREISSARPGGRYRPSSVTTGMAVEGPLMARTESRDQYESARSKGGSASPNSTISSISCSSVSSRGSTGSPTSSTRPPDPRFSAGSTTRSTYRDVSAHTEEARQRPVVPESSLRMEGDFERSVSSKEHFRNAGLYSRTPAVVRKPMIPKASGNLDTRTSYMEQIEDKAQFNGLRRSSRFDYGLRIPDKIDWI